MNPIPRMEYLGFFASGLTWLSVWYLGSISYWGWLVGITGSGVWIVYAFWRKKGEKLYSIAFINVILLLTEVRGLLVWVHVL